MISPTNRVNLKSILQKGSTLRPPQKMWDNDDVVSVFGEQCAPRSGKEGKDGGFLRNTSLGVRPPFLVGQDIIPNISSPPFPDLHPTVLELCDPSMKYSHLYMS